MLGKVGLNSDFTQGSSDDGKIVYRNNMIQFAYDTILTSQDNEVTGRIFKARLHKICTNIEVALDKLHMSSNDEGSEPRMIHEQDDPDEINDTNPILNPHCLKLKGVSNARLKGHFENERQNLRQKHKLKVLPISIIFVLSAND
ncbi:hypothetical protein M5689_011067 [Euphorbia peplus]|nr:hypothetical protein M5689_011067 [Euphorbia peplus]